MTLKLVHSIESESEGTKGTSKMAEVRTLRMMDIVDEKVQLGIAQLMSQDLPMEIAYEFVKIADVVAKHRKHYEQLRKPLLDKFVKKDEHGVFLTIAEGRHFDIPDMLGFEKAHEELANLEVHVPTMLKSALGKEVKVKPIFLQALSQTILA